MHARFHATLFVLLALFAAISLWGCQSTTPTVEEEPAPEVPEEAAVWVDGWSCESPAACFGLDLGRERVFSRVVGTRDEQESWTITATEDAPEGALFRQEGGPATYLVNERGLSTTIRGELVEAIRFPARAGDSFTINTGENGHVRMRVERVDAEVSALAGSFQGCLVHEASFETRDDDTPGLVVETTWCEGIGEVAQQIQLADMPLPVFFELVSIKNEMPTLAQAQQ